MLPKFHQNVSKLILKCLQNITKLLPKRYQNVHQSVTKYDTEMSPNLIPINDTKMFTKYYLNAPLTLFHSSSTPQSRQR